MPSQTDRPDILNDCRALYLQRLGDALRNCAVLPGGAVAAVVDGAGKSFDDMVALARRGSFSEHARDLTSSRLTLVGHDDLELSLRLDRFATRLFEATANSLWKPYLRFITLLARPDLPKDDNPVGPRGIAEGLDAMFAAAGTMALERKLELIDRLEERLLTQLPGVYEEINRFLREAGIEASQPSIVTPAESPLAASRPATAPAPASGNPLATLHQALLARFASGSGSAGSQPALSPINREQLHFRLGEFDRRGHYRANYVDDANPQLEALIPGLFADQPADNGGPSRLGASELGLPPLTPEGLLIDTLASIFEAILNDQERPQVLKTAISQLRVTIIKQALRNDDQLASEQSPSRRLIDLLGQAVVGLPVDTPPTHPFCARLLALAELLRSDFDRHPEATPKAIAGLEALLAERQAAVARHAETYLPVIEQLERSDQAHFSARQILSKANSPDTPAEIRTFLDAVWKGVLQQTWLEFGPNSPQWQGHSALVGNLLWTFRPKTEAEERKVLASRLPEVLRQLKSGMEYVGLATEEQARILDLCFSLQTRAMRSQNPAAGGPPAANPLPRNAPESREIRLGNVRAGDKTVLSLDFRQPDEGTLRRLPCRPGDWLKLSVGSRQCVLWMSGLSPAGQRVLLVNPEDEPPLLVHKAILENLFRTDEALICGKPSLFDAATASATDGMRRKSGG